jgi:hypothetical protein
VKKVGADKWSSDTSHERHRCGLIGREHDGGTSPGIMIPTPATGRAIR